MDKHTFQFEGAEYELLHPKLNIPRLGVRTAKEICVDKKAQAMLVRGLGGDSLRKVSKADELDIIDDGVGDDPGESLTPWDKFLEEKGNAELDPSAHITSEEELEKNKQRLSESENPTPAVPKALKG